MKLLISAASHVGCVRQNNEDMILVGEQFVRNDHCNEEANLSETDRYLVALADGMGGHSSGEVPVGDFNEAIYEWLASINHVIDAKGKSEPQYRDMGTTLVALAYYAGNFYWMNCGDSRLYRYHDGRLQQLSTDHSLNTLMGVSEHSNIITNCIGGGCDTSYIDLVQCTASIQQGDTLMLCSDGLTDMLSDIEIQDLLANGADAVRLCDAANAAGGYDNVSVSLIKIV